MVAWTAALWQPRIHEPPVFAGGEVERIQFDGRTKAGHERSSAVRGRSIAGPVDLSLPTGSSSARFDQTPDCSNRHVNVSSIEQLWAAGTHDLLSGNLHTPAPFRKIANHHVRDHKLQAVVVPQTQSSAAAWMSFLAAAI